MISEALELRVESRRVCRSWCMCLVGHRYGGVGGGRDGGGGRYARWSKLIGLVAYLQMPEHFQIAW